MWFQSRGRQTDNAIKAIIKVPNALNWSQTLQKVKVYSRFWKRKRKALQINCDKHELIYALKYL